MTRTGTTDDDAICPAQEWQEQHNITAEEALPMMTINAAYALFRESEVGSLEPGKYADMIILSGNPLAVRPEEIPQLDIWMTMIGGRSAHCAAGYEGICP